MSGRMNVTSRLTARGAGVLLLLLFSGLARAAVAQPSVDELVLGFDDLFRGSSSEGRTTMRVKTERWDRTLTMQVWAKGTERTLVQILAPPKEKGTSTLKVGKNIWNYLPKVDRTIKVPASMMSAAWMGSHFTNDDLVQGTRYSEDFVCDFADGSPGEEKEPYVIDCVPTPTAPVVWGKVTIRIEPENLLPVEVVFFDEKGTARRQMSFGDIGELGGRTLPRRMRVIPLDQPNEFTEMTYEEMRFDVDIPDRQFSLQALRP